MVRGGLLGMMAGELKRKLILEVISDVPKVRTNLFSAVGHKHIIESHIYETKYCHLTVIRETVIPLSHRFLSIMDTLV